MNKFNLPKVKYDPPNTDELNSVVADMGLYKSPIELTTDSVRTKMEDDIMTAIWSYGVKVDKEELIKALQYDRDSFEKGFKEGYIKAQREMFDELDILAIEYVNRYISPIEFVGILTGLKKKYLKEATDDEFN